MASNNTHSSGIGLCGMMFILFLGLKITHNIDWSWWWVTAPLWGLPVLVLLLLGVVFLGYVVILAVKG